MHLLCGHHLHQHTIQHTIQPMYQNVVDALDTEEEQTHAENRQHRPGHQTTFVDMDRRIEFLKFEHVGSLANYHSVTKIITKIIKMFKFA